MSKDDFAPVVLDPPGEQKILRQLEGPPSRLVDTEDDALQIVEEMEYEDDRVRTDVDPQIPAPTKFNLFYHPDAHPFVLDLALLRQYGPEWMQWEPETLEFRILNDFKAKGLTQRNFDKLQAAKSLHLSDLFWESWVTFCPCAQALSNSVVDFRVLSSLTVPQLLIAVDTASKLRADMEYRLEVKLFMETCYLHDGMLCAISPLDKILNIKTDDYGVDIQYIKDHWDEVRASKKVPESETVENEQLRRMLEAHDLLEDSRKQLNDQLSLLYR